MQAVMKYARTSRKKNSCNPVKKKEIQLSFYKKKKVATSSKQLKQNTGFYI